VRGGWEPPIAVMVESLQNGMIQLPCISGMVQLHSYKEGNFPISFYNGPKEMNWILNRNHIKKLQQPSTFRSLF
jgi:hypothetical protein